MDIAETSYGARLTELAASQPTTARLTIVARNGEERPLTFAELERRRQPDRSGVRPRGVGTVEHRCDRIAQLRRAHPVDARNVEARRDGPPVAQRSAVLGARSPARSGAAGAARERCRRRAMSLALARRSGAHGSARQWTVSTIESAIAST